MPNVFISYRRDDSAASARLLYERMAADFGAGNVFMDVKDIAVGDAWQQKLDAEMSRASTVIALIGRNWIDCTDATGRRLDNPDDSVGRELVAAFERRKRVIPVLVDNAAFPPAEALPEPLRPLAALNYFRIDHLRFERDVADLLEKISGEAAPAVRLRMVAAAAVVVPLAIALVLVVAALHLADVLGLETRAASSTMAVGDSTYANALDDRLVLVGFQPAVTQDEGQALRPERRQQFARLIDLLARAGARATVFDVVLGADTSYDAELRASIVAAATRQHQVVFGFNAIDPASGDPLVPTALRGTAIGLGLGVVCVGAQLGRAALPTLALIRGARRYPSLPLLAALGPVRIPERAPADGAVYGRTLTVLDAKDEEEDVAFSLLQHFDVADRACPARDAGSDMARLIVPFTERDRLRAPGRRFTLDDVLSGKAPADAFRGKTVLVGVEHPADQVQTRLDPLPPGRYGFELQADAINALLGHAVVRQPGLIALGVIAAVVAVPAAAWRTWRSGRAGWGDVALLVAALAACWIVAVLCYGSWRILINPLFPSIALLGTWFVLARLDRRWSHGDA